MTHQNFRTLLNRKLNTVGSNVSNTVVLRKGSKKRTLKDKTRRRISFKEQSLLRKNDESTKF